MLTPRQTEILQLLANGNSHRQIALNLGISKDTIKNHMHDIGNRLGTQGRVEAIMYAAYLGIIDLELSQQIVKSTVESRYS